MEVLKHCTDKIIQGLSKEISYQQAYDAIYKLSVNNEQSNVI